MYKEIHEYEDWDGNDASTTLWFNLTKTELTENLHLHARFENLESRLAAGGNRELTVPEIQEMLDLVKTFMKLAYGVRPADDPEQFKKSDEIWDRFVSTAAYDTYLYSLFENPAKGVSFLLGILPKSLREQAQEQTIALEEAQEAKTPVLPTAPPVLEQSKKFENYSKPELLAMSEGDYNTLVGTDPEKWTREQLLISMQRKNQQ